MDLHNFEQQQDIRALLPISASKINLQGVGEEGGRCNRWQQGLHSELVLWLVVGNAVWINHEAVTTQIDKPRRTLSRGNFS